ncbi:hypothetical protein GCM10010388_27200 [Streptomyces mauvecolor]
MIVRTAPAPTKSDGSRADVAEPGSPRTSPRETPAEQFRMLQTGPSQVLREVPIGGAAEDLSVDADAAGALLVGQGGRFRHSVG